MPRYNLGSGIGQGIQNGLLAFAQAKDSREDRDLRRQEMSQRTGLLKRNQAFDEASKGLLYDETSGRYSVDPKYTERKLEEDSRKIKQDRETGLLKEGYKPQYDEQGEVTSLRSLPGFHRKKDAAEMRIDPFLKPQLDNASTTLAKRAGGVDKLAALLQQLEDPTKTEAEKIAIGEGGYKLLNDPENPDVVGAEEAKRLGKYLQPGFHPFRPGSTWFGRDLDAFKQQVRNKLEQAQGTTDAAETKLRHLSGRSGARDNAGLLKPLEKTLEDGRRVRKVKGGWEVIGG